MAAGLDRLLDLQPAARRAPPPRPEKRARSSHVGDVAVAVVGRLGEHGEDQLLEGRARAAAPPAGP